MRVGEDVELSDDLEWDISIDWKSCFVIARSTHTIAQQDLRPQGTLIKPPVLHPVREHLEDQRILLRQMTDILPRFEEAATQRRGEVARGGREEEFAEVERLGVW